jgi:hypothetical protein
MDDRVIITQVLEAPNEERRELSSGSANGSRTITCRTTTGLGERLAVAGRSGDGVRDRRAPHMLREPAGIQQARSPRANIRVVAPRQTREGAPDRLLVSIFADTGQRERELRHAYFLTTGASTRSSWSGSIGFVR